jgi:hypothetical protein
MRSSGMLRCVALVRTDDSDGFNAFVIRTRISERGTTLGVTSNLRTQSTAVARYGESCSLVKDSCHPDDGGAMFLRNVASHKSHFTAVKTSSHTKLKLY